MKNGYPKLSGNSLAAREKSLIKREFNRNGYVLDFSNSSFDSFTLDSIGIAVQSHYELSKGASLECFFDDADDCSAGKLLHDLVQYRKDGILFSMDTADSREQTLLEECERIASRLCSPNSNVRHVELLKQSTFGTEYINQQVDQMYNSLDENPTDAIGKAKELLESCAKTILKERNVGYVARTDFSELIKLTVKELHLDRDSVPDDKKASETIKKTLSCLSTIINSVNELRNSYGTGHGKENDYSGLSPRHARLVVGLASTATTFLWDTHTMLVMEAS